MRRAIATRAARPERAAFLSAGCRGRRASAAGAGAAAGLGRCGGVSAFGRRYRRGAAASVDATAGADAAVACARAAATRSRRPERPQEHGLAAARGRCRRRSVARGARASGGGGSFTSCGGGARSGSSRRRCAMLPQAPVGTRPGGTRRLIGKARIVGGLHVHDASVIGVHHDAQLSAHPVGGEQHIARAAARRLRQRPKAPTARTASSTSPGAIPSCMRRRARSRAAGRHRPCACAERCREQRPTPSAPHRLRSCVSRPAPLSSLRGA